MKTLDKLDQDWLLAAEVHRLEARLWRKVHKRGIQSVMITSAMRGEGKSTTVAYLATALASHPDRRILAVDLDFREPQLRDHFEVKDPRDIGAAIRGERSIEDVCIQTSLHNLHLVLPAPGGDDPGLLNRTREFTAIIDYFKRNYDLILLDVPALVPVADAATLLPLSDAVILVAMAGRTTRQDLTRAREICLGMEANILGLVVGNLQEALPEYGYDRYAYGYQTEMQRGGRDDGPRNRR